MVCWVLDRNILKGLYYRAHDLFMGRRGGRYIDNIQLVGFKLLSGKSNEIIRILCCPEIYVESVKSKKVLSLVMWVGVWEPPVMFRLLYGRCRFFMVTAIAVHYDGTQGRMFVRLAHNS